MKMKWIWIVLALGVVGLVAYRLQERAASQQTNAADATADLPLVKVTPAVRQTVAETISVTGTIRPRNEVQVLPKIGGRIESLSAEVGDAVKAGQVLAVIEHKELSWQAKAADAALKVAQAQLEGARLEFNRTQALFKSGATTQAQLDGARIKLSLAEAQSAQAEAAAGLAAQQVSNARVASPIDGVVTRRAVDLGAQVGPSSLLFTVQDLQSLKVQTSVDASVFARLARGAEAHVHTDTFPGVSFPATLKIISPSLDAMSRRAEIELEVDNTSGKLVPNLFVRADVKVGTLENALVVPRLALLESAGGARVFRVKGDRVEAVVPKFGPAAGDSVVVLEGLNEGDVVATNGLGNLSDGAKVRVAAEPKTASRALPTAQQKVE